jgi:hypothetical protein
MSFTTKVTDSLGKFLMGTYVKTVNLCAHHTPYAFTLTYFREYFSAGGGSRLQGADTFMENTTAHKRDAHLHVV